MARDWELSPYALPLRALSVWGRCLLPLVIWYAGGHAVRYALLYVSTVLSHGSWYQARLVLVMFLFTLVVMTSLATTVGMLHSVRGALAEIRARRSEGAPDEGILGALNRTALVFAGIYLTWGLLIQDVDAFAQLDVFREPDKVFTDALFNHENTQGLGLVSLDVKVSLIAMAVAYVVRWIFGRIHDQGRAPRVSGMLATFGELAFTFYGLNATLRWGNEKTDWIGGRTVVAAYHDWMADAKAGIPGWEAFWSFVGEVWPHVIQAVVFPLAWLTVAVLVFGAYADDTKTTIRGTPLEVVAVRMNETHSLTRSALARFTGGWTSRWVPLLNSLRLTVRGGFVLFGMFVLCYMLLQVGGDYLTRAGRYLGDGDGQPYLWMVTGPPVGFLSDMVITTLTMALLATTFDLAATRTREQAP
ncbi:hypothetical protein J5X84_14625 [Streptosporangiaceae bacterium NEAU-GS5]|nr:hypothetical protein [Streptosporangiaceae bacterium NEAU-GS5]